MSDNRRHPYNRCLVLVFSFFYFAIGVVVATSAAATRSDHNQIRYLKTNGGSGTEDDMIIRMKKTKPPKQEKKEKISKEESGGMGKGGMKMMMMGKGGKGGMDGGGSSSGMMMGGKGGGMGMMEGGGKGGMMTSNKVPTGSPSPSVVTSEPTTTTASPTIQPNATPVSPTVTPLPIGTTAPSPTGMETQAPSTMFPIVTDEPVTASSSPTITPTMVPTPSNQPIAIAPTDFISIGSSNIVVRYNGVIGGGTVTPVSITYNDTLEVIDITCDYLRTEGVLRPFMGAAIEFLCIWFLPPEFETTPQMFPVDIIYAGTAAFTNNSTNVTTELLDMAIIESLSEPYVTNLTTLIQTQLPNNPFSNIESIIPLL